jgi:hypothetical protein
MERTGLRSPSRSTTSRTSGSKYGNKKETIDGIAFDSNREANRYVQLRALERLGEITQLVPNPDNPKKRKFDLLVMNPRGVPVKVGSLTPDFTYYRGTEYVVEDAKGARTPVYNMKKRHCEAQYGVVIRDV